MDKQELIEEIKQRRSRLRPCGEGSIATVSDAVFSQCLELAEQLDSSPAMTWQAEPSEDGWHWVEGMKHPRELSVWSGKWWVGSKSGRGLIDLRGRRVCPIPAPPALPKRGGA